MKTISLFFKINRLAGITLAIVAALTMFIVARPRSGIWIRPSAQAEK